MKTTHSPSEARPSIVTTGQLGIDHWPDHAKAELLSMSRATRVAMQAEDAAHPWQRRVQIPELFVFAAGVFALLILAIACGMAFAP